MEYREALREAKVWSTSGNYSANKEAAKAYINAMPLAKDEAIQMGLGSDEGEKVQLLYITCNLGSWRGEVAKEAKVALKARIKELGG